MSITITSISDISGEEISEMIGYNLDLLSNQQTVGINIIECNILDIGWILENIQKSNMYDVKIEFVDIIFDRLINTSENILHIIKWRKNVLLPKCKFMLWANCSFEYVLVRIPIACWASKKAVSPKNCKRTDHRFLSALNSSLVHISNIKHDIKTCPEWSLYICLHS